MKQKFDVQPHVGPLPLRFGMSQERVMQLLGQPLAKRLNPRQERDWDYGAFSVRFDPAGEGVVEVGFLPEAELTLSGIDLFGDPGAFAKVVALAHDVFEDVGVIVIPSLGLTLKGFHDAKDTEKMITVFADGRWDARRSRFKPFALNARTSAA